MRKENVVNNKGLSSRKVWRPAGFRDLPSAKSLLNKEQQPYCMKQAEGPGQRPAGTTTFFYNGGFTLFPALYPAFARPARTGMTNGAGYKFGFSCSVIPQCRNAGYSKRNQSGFTLIELLVVVLIIGILAAVALPQYQKAVDKTRFMQALTMHKAVYDAQQVFYLTNGRYAKTWGELADLDLPTPASGGGENDTYAWWKWGYCFLVSGAYGGCGIGLSGSPARTIQHWSSRNKECYAPKTSARAQRTCEAVTGKSFSQATSVGDDYVYSF